MAKRGSLRAILAVGAAALGALLMTAVLHPIWPLQASFLSLMSISLAGLAWLLAKRTHRPAQGAWVDWLALGTAGLALGWLFLTPRLLLPFSLQVICRILGVSLSLVAAVAFHRALPRHLHWLGALFPLVPIALSFLLPLGPARWETGPLSPNEVQFAGRLLVARAAEGPVLVYDFPGRYPVTVAGFSPYRIAGYPSLAADSSWPETPQLKWAVALAVLEDYRKLSIKTIFSRGAHGGHAFYIPLYIQTRSHLLAVAPGPEHTFLAVYWDRERNVWARRMDVHGGHVGFPIQLPGQPQALAASPDGRLVAYVESDLHNVRVVDIETGDDVLLDISQEIAAVGGYDTYIHSLAIAPDGSELALGLAWKGNGDCPGLIWRVDLEGKVLARLLPPTRRELRHEPFVSILRYSPDGNRLAAEICCFPSRLSVVDIDSGRVRSLPLGGQGYGDAAFSPDGQYLVATRYDGIYLWRIGR
jgi:hypothetical protein